MENCYLIGFKIYVTHLILTENHVILNIVVLWGRIGSACKFYMGGKYDGCNQNRL